MGCSLRDWEERCLPAIECRPVSACTVLLQWGITKSDCGLLLSMWRRVPFCPTLPSQDEPIGGPVLGVGGAQEEEGWRLHCAADEGVGGTGRGTEEKPCRRRSTRRALQVCVSSSPDTHAPSVSIGILVVFLTVIRCPWCI